MLHRSLRTMLDLALILVLLTLATTMAASAQAPEVMLEAAIVSGGQARQGDLFTMTSTVGAALGSRQSNNGFTVQSGMVGINARAQYPYSDHAYFPFFDQLQSLPLPVPEPAPIPAPAPVPAADRGDRPDRPN